MSQGPPAVSELATGVDAELTRIVARVAPDAKIVRVEALGTDDAAIVGEKTGKAAGYGVPLRIDIERAGERRSLVLHGTSPNRFGHDRRADRAAELLLAADTFGSVPRHVQVFDVGAFRSDGSTVSLTASGEFYLLTDFVEGTPYATDLRRIARTGEASPTDFERVDALVDYLLALHVPADGHPFAYERSLRDLLGSGEGVFGIVDAYPTGPERERLQRIEERCLGWRWRLKTRAPRLSRIHGDFHPFNVLFDDSGALHLLDTSRGSLGDPADDVACMAVNYVFFAVEQPRAWRAAFAPLWRRFWARYLERSADGELLACVAPFLAWRLLVLGCPLWYPNLSAEARQRLFSLIDAALEHERFEPTLAEELFE
jgi:hypothetical protein